MAENQLKTFILTGGEDLVTPPLEIPEGVARIAYNYEQNYDTGYTRIEGYRKLVNDVTPGEGTAHVVIFNNAIYLFKDKVGGLEGGVWRATPATYDEDTGAVLTNGSWTEITDIQDASGVATTLAPNGHHEFVIHNFKATAADFGVTRGDWTATTAYLRGDIITDSAGVLGAVDSVWITNVAHTSTASLLDDTALWSSMTWTTEAGGDPHDVSGSSGKLYGADGVNPAFEFDGITLKLIDTTYTPDIPLHIEANGNRLALGFRSGEIAISSQGNPLNFDPILGAGSIGVTDYLTGMSSGPDGVLEIYCRDKLYLYYGMAGALADTELKKHSKDVGAYPYTQQKLGQKTLFFDTWGITDLEVTQKFGDVITSSLSSKIQNILLGVQPTASVVVKDKSQYRLYFSTNTGGVDSDDTTCIIATLIRGENLGFTHAVYPISIHHMYGGRIGLEEYTLAGTVDGEVFHMDAGTSFDGAEYNSYMSLPFNYLGSPHKIKKVRKIMMNIDATNEVAITGSVDFDFGNKAHPKDTGSDIVNPRGDRWGVGVWNEFIWGTGYTDYVESYINGHGYNLSVTISTTSATDRPHTLKDISYIYQYQRIDH